MIMSQTSRVMERDDFLERHGWSNGDLVHLAGDASFRSYKRLKRPVEVAVLTDAPPPQGIDPFIGQELEHVVLMDAPPPKEDVTPFITIAKYLRHHGLNAPEILAEDTEHGFLLLEDFGDDRYTRILNDGSPELEDAMYRYAVDVLAALYKCDLPEAARSYSPAMLLKESSLFVDWYIPLIHGRSATDAERNQFDELMKAVIPHTVLKDEVLVLRDYHADNLMWLPDREGLDKVGLLDFQDAVAGSPAYDLVSLLEDARRDVEPELAEKMIRYYLMQLPQVDKEAFRISYALLGAQRNLKILGIFARLGLRDAKYNYRLFMPRVWRYLEQDLAHPLLKDLKAWLDDVIPPAIRSEVPPMPENAANEPSRQDEAAHG